MILRYRITMPGFKAFVRVYDVEASMSLYEFHKRLRDDMELPHDQLIQFKALGVDGNLVARYGLFDLGWGAVDGVTLGNTVENGVASYVYFYNVTDRKSVVISFEGEVEPEEGMEYPMIVESKGPVPAEVESNPAAYMETPEERLRIAREARIAAAADAGFPKDDDGDDDIEDLDEDFDEDIDDEEEDDNEEDGQIIFDGSEDLGF